MANLHEVPRFSDRWDYIYLERGQLDRPSSSVVFREGKRETRIPVDQFSSVLLGPGTSITAAAMKTFAESNCVLCWSGEDGLRLYAHGRAGTHSSHRLLRQAELYANRKKRLAVVRRMYEKQSGQKVSRHLGLEQMRGMEGKRVQRVYAQLASDTGVSWKGRRYDQDNWSGADPLNRALSVANACLYGLCHAAILSAGYSPAIGFIHTGKMLSFVYDIADFYKSSVTAPLAFEIVKEGSEEIERRTRIGCRQAFFAAGLMDRLLPDIAEVLDASDDIEERPGELEGRAVSLADRTGSGGVPGEPECAGEK